MQVFQLVVLAVEGEGFPAPAVADDLHPLLEPAHPLAHRHLEGPEISLLVSQAHAQDDSPLGHQVQGDHVLRQVYWVVQGQQNYRRAHLQGAGLGGHRRRHDQRGRQEPVRVLVVLAEEARVETHLLRQPRLSDNLVDPLVQPLAPGRVGEGAVNAELHVWSPLILLWINDAVWAISRSSRQTDLSDGILAGQSNGQTRAGMAREHHRS